MLNRLLLVAGLLAATSSAAVAQQVWFKWAFVTSSNDKAQHLRQAFTKEGDSWKRDSAFDTKRECIVSLPQFGTKERFGDDGNIIVVGEDPTVVLVESPTFASLLIEAREDLPYIQHQLGHHSAAFTSRVYGHLIPRQGRRGVDALDDASIRNPRATAHPVASLS